MLCVVYEGNGVVTRSVPLAKKSACHLVLGSQRCSQKDAELIPLPRVLMAHQGNWISNVHSCRDLSVSCSCERLPFLQVWCRRETCLRSVADPSSCVVGAHSLVLRICCGTASPRKGTTRRARMHPQHPPPSACSHSITPSYFDIFGVWEGDGR